MPPPKLERRPALPRRKKLRTPLSAHGEPMLWLTGGALLLCLIMVFGLVALVVTMGLGTFWPAPLELVELNDGTRRLGAVTRVETYEPGEATLEAMDPVSADRARSAMADGEGQIGRRLFRTGNFEITNSHFYWVDDPAIARTEFPDWALTIERTEWGRFFGLLTGFRIDGEDAAGDPAEAWSLFREHHAAVLDRRAEIIHLDKHDLGELRHEREAARLAVRDVEVAHDLASSWARAYRHLFDVERDPDATEADREDARRRLERLDRNLGGPTPSVRREYDEALAAYTEIIGNAERRNAGIIEEIDRRKAENRRFRLVMATADGGEQDIALDQVVRAFPANQLGFIDRLRVYLSRWGEFLTQEPRAANSAGGVFPAIVGTVIMTLIMAILVVPFGVMAALYLREYAKAGPIVSAVRIAINHLAGVPSIVFGVFGLGFFCYGVGGFIDGGPTWKLPPPTWFGLLAAAVAVAALAFLTLMLGLKRPGRPLTRARRSARVASGTLWVTASLAALALIATTPFFDGFFRAGLPNPTFAKGGLAWASFTLALLTLPVVIVATEEALAAVPNSMREGSFACGASKWQTIKRIVLPRAMPGIMTGTILAMARGAGEVAPLMLVGAVKFVGELPISADPGEHFGINRSFMHLGFHIYDLGFQSQNSEAAKPMVFTTTLLLIAIIATLNLAAVALRSRLRRRFVGAQF